MFIGYQEKIIGYKTKTEVNEQGERVEIQVPIKKEFIVFAAATKEALENNLMVFDRVEETQDNYVLNDKGEYTIDGVSSYTDDEIIAKRASMYASVSDPLFASYEQGGQTTLQQAIQSKARIQFDNKKSTQGSLTLADFVHKVTTEYALSKARTITPDNLTYEYQENSGSDDVIVGDKTINLVRTTSNCNIVLPKISKVQTVKIDNISEDTITISQTGVDFIDGVSSQYTLSAKQSVEFISNTDANNWDLYTPVLEIESTITIEDLFGNSFSGVSKIQIGKDLTLQKVDNDTIKIEAVETDNRPVSLYASLAVPEEVVGRGSSAIAKGPVWFDNVISGVRTNYMDLRMAEKSYGIQEYDGKDPNVTGGQPYLIVFRPSFRGKAPADGFIQIALYDTKTNLPALDIDGKPLSVYKTFKEGDVFGVMRVSGIIKAKALQYLQARVIDSFPKTETLVLNDYTDGNSCLLIVALDGEKVSESLLKYELDNNERLLISKHYLGELYNAAFLLQRDMPQTEGAAEQGETNADGSHLYNKSKLNIEINNRKIIFSSVDNDICQFNWGYIIPAEITNLIKGKNVTVEAALRNPDCAVNIQLIKWKGTPDKYTTKIITDNINDQDVFEPNWEAVDKVFVSKNTTRTAVSKSFIIPDDAVNVAFIVTPSVPQNPILIEIDRFVVSVDNPGYEYIIKGFETIEEKQMYWQNDTAKYSNVLPAGMAAYRFSGSNIAKPLPFGIAKGGNIPADLKPWDKKEGTDFGNENDLAFYDDANVSVDLVVNIHAPKLEPVFFFLTKDGKEIPNTRVSFTPQVEHEQEAVIPTMSVKVLNGDVIGLGFETTSEDGAYLETDDVKYPMLTAKVNTKGAI